MKSSKKGCEGKACRLERKAVEKNRRMHMKSLCLKLSTLIPEQQISSFSSSVSKDSLTQKDHLDQAAIYIRKLRARIEQLRQKKELGKCIDNEGIKEENTRSNGVEIGFRLPVVEVRYVGSTLEVVLICGMKNSPVFYKIISVLEEEGAQVSNASFSSVGDKIYYTIHSQVTACPKVGLEASRVSERIKQLVL